jgi:hypothetical protein
MKNKERAIVFYFQSQTGRITRHQVIRRNTCQSCVDHGDEGTAYAANPDAIRLNLEASSDRRKPNTCAR